MVNKERKRLDLSKMDEMEQDTPRAKSAYDNHHPADFTGEDTLEDNAETSAQDHGVDFIVDEEGWRGSE